MDLIDYAKELKFIEKMPIYIKGGRNMKFHIKNILTALFWASTVYFCVSISHPESCVFWGLLFFYTYRKKTISAAVVPLKPDYQSKKIGRNWTKKDFLFLICCLSLVLASGYVGMIEILIARR